MQCATALTSQPLSRRFAAVRRASSGVVAATRSYGQLVGRPRATRRLASWPPAGPLLAPRRPDHDGLSRAAPSAVLLTDGMAVAVGWLASWAMAGRPQRRRPHRRTGVDSVD